MVKFTPGKLLQISNIKSSVFTGWMIRPRSLTGTLMLWKRKLVRREYCSWISNRISNSHRTRNLVYTNKKSLRANPDGIFITEHLTPYRTDLTKRLSQLVLPMTSLLPMSLMVKFTPGKLLQIFNIKSSVFTVWIIRPLIESEVQACVETHINPLKEVVHKQEKTIENHEQKICKQFIQINTLERTVKDHRQNSDAVFVVKFVFEWLAKYQGCLDLTFY
jgi:hypothetical protein